MVLEQVHPAQELLAKYKEVDHNHQNFKLSPKFFSSPLCLTTCSVLCLCPSARTTTFSLGHRMKEFIELEGTFKDHLVQIPSMIRDIYS